MAANGTPDDLSSSEASAAEIISKMSEYQFIAVVHDGNGCEPMEQVVNEQGEVVGINTSEYYETIAAEQAVELNFEGIEMKEDEGSGDVNDKVNEVLNESQPIQHLQQEGTVTTEIVDSNNVCSSTTIENYDQDVNCTNLSVRDILLPLGIKMTEGNTESASYNKKKRLKSTLFIGCSSEATQALQEFENLKNELNIKRNVELLKLLIENTKKLVSRDPSSVECVMRTDNKDSETILHQLMTSPQHEEIVKEECQGDVETKEVTINIVSNALPTLLNPMQDVGEVLGLTALNIKTIQLTKKYLEHIAKEGFYITGFVDGSEKLDEFLKAFRIMTGSAFSIRRSKAKINDDPEPEQKPLRKYKPGYLGKGQIKWEKNIGIPPIPFTGVPFTTEGSTTYQCIYGPKRAKASSKCEYNENEEDVKIDVKENSFDEPTPTKRRRYSRESKKKDCPAQIHIRTVHRFPTYTCLSPIEPIKSTSATTYVNKCQRGIILAKLREDIVMGTVQGEQGFWIRVPLPDVHQNHALGPFDGSESALTEETILEMKSILHNAAITT